MLIYSSDILKGLILEFKTNLKIDMKMLAKIYLLNFSFMLCYVR